MRTLIAPEWLVDGTGAPPRQGEVLAIGEDGHIDAVGPAGEITHHGVVPDVQSRCAVWILRGHRDRRVSEDTAACSRLYLRQAHPSVLAEQFEQLFSGRLALHVEGHSEGPVEPKGKPQRAGDIVEEFPFSHDVGASRRFDNRISPLGPRLGVAEVRRTVARDLLVADRH